jgi:raffinose/stachyose/melibiose transport system substrate-binding protein
VWGTEEGVSYGVPFIAVSHGIYYNEDLFAELGIAVPQTWEELLAAAQTIQDAGYIPFANASGDAWTIAEIVFMNLAPTFIGGYEGRMAYLSGERCFNDENAVVNAFQAVADLAPFLPEGQSGADLLRQPAALPAWARLRCGWAARGTFPVFEGEAPEFEWGVFGIPAPEGQEQRFVTFHLDAGMGVNAAQPKKKRPPRSSWSG